MDENLNVMCIIMLICTYFLTLCHRMHVDFLLTLSAWLITHYFIIRFEYACLWICKYIHGRYNSTNLSLGVLHYNGSRSTDFRQMIQLDLISNYPFTIDTTLFLKLNSKKLFFCFAECKIKEDSTKIEITDELRLTRNEMDLSNQDPKNHSCTYHH